MPVARVAFEKLKFLAMLSGRIAKKKSIAKLKAWKYFENQKKGKIFLETNHLEASRSFFLTMEK